MDPVTIGGIFTLGEKLISRIWPDPQKQAEELRKLEELKQKGDLAELNSHVQLMLKQAEINLADAKSNNWFQAGWRPSIGWVGSISLALMYIPKAIMLTVIWSWQCISLLTAEAVNVASVVLPTFPDLGVTDIIGLLMSMLGVAAMRSHDKTKGVDTK